MIRQQKNLPQRFGDIVPRRGAGRYPDTEVFGTLGVLRLRSPPHRRGRESEVKSVGKPDARNGHVRFDERGWETGRRFGVSARARPRLYKCGPVHYQGESVRPVEKAYR